MTPVSLMSSLSTGLPLPLSLHSMVFPVLAFPTC